MGMVWIYGFGFKNGFKIWVGLVEKRLDIENGMVVGLDLKWVKM